MLVVIVLGVGAAVSVLLYVQMRQAAGRLEHRAFLHHARGRAALLRQAVDGELVHLRAAADFVYSTDQLTGAAFAGFAQPAIRRSRSIRMMAYVVAVPGDRRESREQELARESGPPRTAWQRSSPGEAVAAGRLPDHWVVGHIAAAEGAQEVVGSEVLSDWIRREAFTLARDTGDLAVTAPVAAIHDTHQVVACIPLYEGTESPQTAAERRSRHQGFVVAALQPGRLAQDVLDEGRTDSIPACLFDITSDGEPTLLYRSPYWQGEVGAGFDDLVQKPVRLVEEMEIGARRWALVCTPDPNPGFAGESWAAAGLAAAGLGATMLLAFVLYMVLRQADAVRSQSVELDRANAQLAQRVAEREKARHALADANQDLQQVNREMEAFVSAVSHDLKTPLVAAEMMLTLLQQQLADGRPEEAVLSGDSVRRACRQMRRLIDDLIEHNRAGWAALRPDPIDLGELAGQVVADHGLLTRSDAIQFHVAPDLPVIMADRTRLATALSNLVTNAIRYGCEHASPVIEIGYDLTDDELRLYVRDHGPGVPAQDRDRVFGPFERLHADDEGTGLGLAIVRRVAEVHGGRAWVDETPGGGATFWIALPRSVLLEPRER